MNRPRYTRSAAAFFALIFLCFSVMPLGAVAQEQSPRADASVSGIVVEQTNGLPVPGASVVLYQGDRKVRETAADARGAFSFGTVVPGLYRVRAGASGFAQALSDDFAVLQGAQTRESIVLTRGSESGGSQKVIASVTSTTSALTSTTTITRTIDPNILQNENYFRAGDALRTVPGVNFTGLSSSPGDDLYVDIRGLGETETQALLDGHPVGSIGVYAFNRPFGTYPGAFNYANTPYFALSKVQVTFGSGASGLYGVDATGGTVDMETLNPTSQRAFTVVQGIGDQGHSESAFKATGRMGRLGYAFAGSVQGQYGDFAPHLIAQTGRPNNFANLPNGGACTSGNDLTSCNLALNTYQVSQQTNIRSGLAKLQYALSGNTSFTGSWFGSGQWADSTGNGDNDNVPYDARLAQIQANPGDCALPGDAAGTTSGYSVVTDANPNACYTAQQFAAASSGPYGGGAGRKRGTSMFDYHARLQTLNGHSTLTADYFLNHYKYWKSSQEALGLDPAGTFFAGQVFSQFLNTQGIMLSNDVAHETSDVGYGYFVEHQLQSRLDYNDCAAGLGTYCYLAPANVGYGSAFARGYKEFTPQFSVFANAWMRRSNVTRQTNLDPRTSFVFRPKNNHDVLRLTFGRTTGDPAAELVSSGAPIVNGNPSSLNPVCSPGANNIATVGNPGLRAEQANDVEFGYAHRFEADSSLQVNVYNTNVLGQLFSARVPIAQFPVVIPAAELAGYASKLSGCPGVDTANPSTVLPYLAVTRTYNAQSARYRGIELSGRLRATRNLYFDYSYDIQSSVQNGLSDQILMDNPTLGNGMQIAGIPVHQGTLGADYSTRSGWEARMDGYWVGDNNVSERPAYSLWNGFVSKQLSDKLALRVGVSNVFNQAVENYGYFGHHLFIPENQFSHDANSIQQWVNNGIGERFGVPPRSVVLTLTASI